MNKFHIFFHLECLVEYAVVQNTKKIWFYHINILKKSDFVLRISWLPKIVHNWFCFQNLRMELSFQEKKTACKSVTWFTSYHNFSDTGEFRRFFFKNPVYMTVYYYVWLCMTMHDYVWLCMTVYDYVGLCMTMYNYVWLCMNM